MNVRKLKIYLIIGVLLMAWLTGWGFRKEITVQDANVDGNLTDFPTLVKRIADADLHEARADGFDIRFTQSDGETLLKYEREYWTGGNGSAATAYLWVKVPSILATGGATIYMYYGKADAPDGEDAVNVWDANYKMVQHMSGASAIACDDSTSNNNDVIADSGAPVYQQAGKIHYAIDFNNATPDYLRIADSASLAMPNEFWISLWFKTTYVNKGEFVSKHPGDYEILYRGFDELIAANWGDSTGQKTINVTMAAAFDEGNWHHLVIWMEKDTGVLKVWLDFTDYKTSTGTASTGSLSNELWIAESVSGANEPFDGLLDEVRIGSTDRGVNWIKFEHANINEADNELTWASEETPAGGEFVYAGDVPLALIGSSPTGILNMVYGGNIPMSVLPSYTSILDRVYAGAIPMSVLPGYSSILDRVYSGDIPLIVLPDFPKAILEKSYDGDISLVISPNSIYELLGEFEFVYSGDIPLSILPDYSSILDRIYSGDIGLVLVPGALYSGEKVIYATGHQVSREEKELLLIGERKPVFISKEKPVFISKK